jgi:hypothetical protein
MYADDTQNLVVVEANYATVRHTTQYARLGLFSHLNLVIILRRAVTIVLVDWFCDPCSFRDCLSLAVGRLE